MLCGPWSVTHGRVFIMRDADAMDTAYASCRAVVYQFSLDRLRHVRYCAGEIN
jgi:hypothetical protein